MYSICILVFKCIAQGQGRCQNTPVMESFRASTDEISQQSGNLERGFNPPPLTEFCHDLAVYNSSLGKVPIWSGKAYKGDISWTHRS